MSIDQSTTAADFVRAAEACAILGRSKSCLQKLVGLGRVRTLRLPGSYPRYHRGDLERLVRESVLTPA